LNLLLRSLPFALFFLRNAVNDDGKDVNDVNEEEEEEEEGEV